MKQVAETREKKISSPDVSIEKQGSLFAFTLHSRLACDWVRLHVDVADWLWQGDTRFLCEHRYAFNIASGMAADGLKVE